MIFQVFIFFKKIFWFYTFLHILKFQDLKCEYVIFVPVLDLRIDL